MMEETDLLIIAKLSLGTPNEDDAFILRDIVTDEIKYRIHNLQELVQVLSDIQPEEIFPSLCRIDREEFECDIALWVHYVLGDASLSAKIFLLVDEFKENPKKLKLEIFNLCFNRYLNFKEILEYQDVIIPFQDEKNPPADL